MSHARAACPVLVDNVRTLTIDPARMRRAVRAPFVLTLIR